MEWNMHSGIYASFYHGFYQFFHCPGKVVFANAKTQPCEDAVWPGTNGPTPPPSTSYLSLLLSVSADQLSMQCNITLASTCKWSGLLMKFEKKHLSRSRKTFFESREILVLVNNTIHVLCK